MAELREIGPEQLKEILEAHRKWVETEGREGEKAYLINANLQGANLREANLRGVNLHEANLQGAYMIKADLQEANLVGANLQEATPYGANFQGAVLRDANLQGTKLLTTRGLTARQVKAAKNWELAFYSDDFLKELG
ncbi:MAG: pentapeptide repeat-containing protein, partial [Deltaproteobacteria bacterium]|nr:pentapeptide repeat-containing protein [Deltaproteobacteria bacterium]